MSTLTNFYLFPTFPIEIRLKIWAIALSTPRTIIFGCKKTRLKTNQPIIAISWAPNCLPASLLHVNRESRFEALIIYTPYFSTSESPNFTYLNLAIDTVRISDSSLQYLASPERASIQKMTLHTKDCAYFGHFNMGILKDMRVLKELEIQMERGAVYSWEQGWSDRTVTNALMVDFEEAIALDPGWECPRVRIFNAETDELLNVIEGGARIPGWTEETAHLFEDTNV